MKEVRVSEVQNHLRRYLALVRRGETVRILDHDRPVAQIVPILDAATGGQEALTDMERRGLVRRGTGSVGSEILEHDPPGTPGGVLAALLDERGSR